MDTLTHSNNARSSLARGEQAYLGGRYDDAAAAMTAAAAMSLPFTRVRTKAHRYLSLAYFQMNDYESAARLPGNDALTRLMRSFTAPPYQIDWRRHDTVSLDFIQEHEWELPQVEIQANGEVLAAKIDTGGDLLSLPWKVAERLGVRIVARQTGWFAGGKPATTGKGILSSLELGGVSLAGVPVSVNAFDHAIVGTGLLRQFTATIDYPKRRLLLAPRSSRHVDGVPFRLAATHLLIAEGELNGLPVNFLVDSGLEVSTGAAVVAPKRTLEKVGIDPPQRKAVAGASGAGHGRLRIGEFTTESVSLARRTRTDVAGMTGIFPRQLSNPNAVGVPVHALVSHGFLRHYSWTIDFEQMRMNLAEA